MQLGTTFQVCQDDNVATRSERRADALSKERITSAAIDILDADGDAALTFRALAARLSTGSGAIYWHVANKDELLAAATNGVVDRVITGASTEAPRGADPRQAIRVVALAVFDALDAHPWVGAHLSRAPQQSAMSRIFEAIGSQVQALDIPEDTLFDAASALVNYILGVAGQNSANARLHGQDMDRTAVLTAVADRWQQLDQQEFPFLHRIADQMPRHDDRHQFLAGIDFILTGIEVAR